MIPKSTRGSGRVPSSKILPKMSAGMPITSGLFEKITAGIDQQTIKSGIGYRIEQTSNGSLLRLNNNNNTISDPVFLLCYAQDNAQGLPCIACTIGMVNHAIPKNNGKYLDDKDSLPLSNPITGDGYVCLKATHDESHKFFPKTSELYWCAGDATALSALADTDTIGYLPLASVKYHQRTKDTEAYISIKPIWVGNVVVVRTKVGSGTAIWYWTRL